MPYIYKIINDVNNKIYIGKTSLFSINERFNQHLNDANRKCREKRPLYEAINKYGKDHFKIELVEEVKNDDIAIEREIYWINKLRTYIGFKDCKGYNATLGGDGKKFHDYLLLANEYINLGSIKKVCRKYNCDPKTVKIACRENNIEINNKNIFKRKIRKIDKNGNYKDYESIRDAAKDFTNKSIETARKNINQALNGNNQTAYGYKWMYLD